MTIQAPSAACILADTLCSFIKKAEAFLQNHYAVGSDDQDIQKILKAIENLHLEVDHEALEAEFELVQEKRDLLNDYCNSAWF